MTTTDSSALIKPLSVLGIGLSGYLSGMIASISLITIPPLLQVHSDAQTTSTVLSTWRAVYNYGKDTNRPLAIVIAAINLGNAYMQYSSTPTASYYLAAAAVATFGIVPWTVIAMTATNDTLFRLEEAKTVEKSGDDSRQDVAGLLKRWSRLNLARAVFPAVGALIGYWAL